MTTETATPLVVNEHDAARTLSLSVATLRRWRTTGEGPQFCKLGNSVRYSTEDLRSYIKERTRKSTSDTGAS